LVIFQVETVEGERVYDIHGSRNKELRRQGRLGFVCSAMELLRNCVPGRKSGGKKVWSRKLALEIFKSRWGITVGTLGECSSCAGHCVRPCGRQRS
jgi:hypothetical protein